MIPRSKLLLLACLAGLASHASATDRKIVFIAGRPSHGPLQHEYRAGSLLLQKCLAGFPGITTEYYGDGWPITERNGQSVDDDGALDGADSIVVYCDGGPNDPLLRGNRLEVLRRLMRKGVGLGMIHWTVEPTKEKGESEFIDWIGGAFETDWSVNPMWTASFKTLPNHPVTRGVKPFAAHDEWYFHLRFRPGMRGVTPILTAVPPAATMNRPDGLYSGNPAVRAAVARGDPQTLMWVVERDDGGRGFGFTGGHYHLGWKNDDQRKVVLNAILWITKIEVPKDGVESMVTDQDLMKNLAPKRVVTRPSTP